MKKAVIFFLTLLMTGCSVREGSLTLMTTKNIGITPQLSAHEVHGEDCMHQVFIFPVGKLNPNIQDAMDNALAKAPEANALRDVRIHQTFFSFPLLFTKICYELGGIPVTYTTPGH